MSPHRHSEIGYLVLLALIGLACAQVARAADCTWNNANGGNWGDAASWDGGVPGAGDNAILPTLSQAYTVNVTGTVSAASATVKSGATLSLQAGAPGSWSHANLTLANDTTNEGIIQLMDYGGGYITTLTVASGKKLTNALGAQIICTGGTGSNNLGGGPRRMFFR